MLEYPLSPQGLFWRDKSWAPHILTKETSELIKIIETENSQNQKSSFWKNKIDNSYESKGLSSETSWRVKNQYISENVNVEIPETPKDEVVKVVNVKTFKEDIKNVPKVKNENVKNVQNGPNIVLTHKQKQNLRTEKYKKQLRRKLVNQSSRNCHNCHCHNTSCSMTTNFQGNQIADSHGKRSINVQQIERISKTKQKPMVDTAQKQVVPNQKMKPQVPKSQNEKVLKKYFRKQ